MIDINKDKSGIATVTLNRPEKHNAFDDAIIARMTEAFIDIDSDDSIRLMILAANGENFCAGADINWMKRMANFSYEENLVDARGLAKMLETLNLMAKPTIARVQGASFGGAVGLVSCCDIAIAAESSYFCLSEVKIGLSPATISPYVIAAIGERAARRYFLSAETFSAERAQQLGLISEICPIDTLDSTIEKISSSILANSPAALKAAKLLIREVSNRELNADLIEDTSKRIAKIRVSKEGQEGLSAFLDKRSPEWLVKNQTGNSKGKKERSDV